ncbi:MAG: amidohydrolase [Elusimicrobiota bacterium]|jgi:amidohydrolase|nr:amidohydrolase [Elusimicrobiota bacterium]
MNLEIKSLVESVKDDVVHWRRHFHQNPERSFQEYKTAEYIKKELETLPNVCISQLTPTSVQVLIKGNAPGKKIALRADIDALPVEENSGEPFSSTNKGSMHACGHDSHAAILMGAVKIASKLTSKIKGEILFIFQHAEELPPGGSIDLINAGVLDKVDMIFGIHADPTIPVGAFLTSKSVYCASSDIFRIIIKGRGAHASMPQKAIDPIVVGSQFVNAMQTIVSRRIDPFVAPVITIATFVAEGEFNIIPDQAYLAGTFRTHQKAVREEIPILIDQTLKGITEAFGAKYDFEVIKGGYPVGVNDEGAYNIVAEVFRDYLQPYQLILGKKPMYGAEDFSRYQEKIPGCFMFYGAGSEKFDQSVMLHSSKFRLNEEGMQAGLSVHIGLIYKLLID